MPLSETSSSKCKNCGCDEFYTQKRLSSINYDVVVNGADAKVKDIVGIAPTQKRNKDWFCTECATEHKF
jgi:hypothetical protein